MGLGTCDALFSLSLCLQVALDRSMDGRSVQFDFSAAFDRASHCSLLYKLMSIGVGTVLPIVSEFFSDRRQRVRLHDKVTASVDVVSGVPQDSVLRPLLKIYASEPFHIIENHIVGYADDTTIYALIHRRLSRSQVTESLN